MTSKIKVDITSIDQIIKKGFQEERSFKTQYKRRIQELLDLIPESSTPQRLTQELERLRQKVVKVCNMVQFKMYIVETSELIEKYKKF